MSPVALLNASNARWHANDIVSAVIEHSGPGCRLVDVRGRGEGGDRQPTERRPEGDDLEAMEPERDPRAVEPHAARPSVDAAARGLRPAAR